jgi:hypothetical protein
MQAPTPFLTLRNSIDSKIDVVDVAGHFVLRHAYLPFDGQATVTLITLSDEEADNLRSYVKEQRPDADTKKPLIN